MELQSFAIGIVTMVVFALAIITVIGILKVTRMAAELLTLKRRVEDDERELSREINMVDQTLQNQLEHRIDNVYQAMENVGRTQSAYTDRRIDKLIDTYFDIENAKKINKTILKD
jgi:predicted Holliday junction resolvase-like endonuclease